MMMLHAARGGRRWLKVSKFFSLLWGLSGVTEVKVPFARVVGVGPPAIGVAFDRQRLDQNSFFRHDFVLAVIAADFEGGGFSRRVMTRYIRRRFVYKTIGEDMDSGQWINGVVTVVVGLVALVVFFLQQQDKRRSAAIILIMDIRHAEQVILEVLQRNSFDRFMGNIQGAKNWEINKHLFVSDLSTDDLSHFNRFFLACSEISEARTDMRSNFMVNINAKAVAAQEMLCQLDASDEKYQEKRREIIKRVEEENYFFNPGDPIDRVVKSIQVMGRLTQTSGFSKLKEIARMTN
jgi:hypothetical protein